APLVEAIRLYQASAPVEVKRYFELQNDGSFSSDTIMLEAHKADVAAGRQTSDAAGADY
ncbi:hypothetical protein MJN54_31230, partial [Salmonella enterica subsp. enterica serovar Kentucky]|nr:hypothetical protein [Salmonella enterica subsp. enterica serovar Kentucky]